ncbi:MULTISPECIES: hypothetical protein [Acinetobacter]|uniref:Uncharacterized protein n=2 Tax=Acinetobacter pittii TaxID=48296 RepID=F0KNN8_ACIP2|nr:MULTISPECIES: hypothetical protein [Acinetobacter]YP_004995369.1 hypothetical protein BDGL_001101 [Acinetobacter pittii PHEA-2]MDU6287393.1 hypothetical protein [Acinetobacter sp.]ADY81687.1 hypothetical protein BDGL_001101 [Acinetobacter pittii PHEA-2]EXE80550.1 hypothetical protein J588_3938 [Acinetobacter sp. 1578804]KCX16777.1 hypothetical protein J723_1174 [Acinetobacter sp. 1264765]MBJ8488591.1 hypothetical protein [Acinetobacter pittii]
MEVVQSFVVSIVGIDAYQTSHIGSIRSSVYGVGRYMN